MVTGEAPKPCDVVVTYATARELRLPQTLVPGLFPTDRTGLLRGTHECLHRLLDGLLSWGQRVRVVPERLVADRITATTASCTLHGR